MFNIISYEIKVDKKKPITYAPLLCFDHSLNFPTQYNISFLPFMIYSDAREILIL